MTEDYMFRRLSVPLLLLLIFALASLAAESEPSNTVGFISFDCAAANWTPFAFPFTYYDANHTVTYSLNSIMVGDFTGGSIATGDWIYDQNQGIFAYKTTSGAWGGSLSTIVPGHAYWAKIQGVNPLVSATTAGEVDMTAVNLGTMASDSWTPVGIRDPGNVAMANSCLISSGFTGGPSIIASDWIYDQNQGIFAWYSSTLNAWQGSLAQLIPGHAYWVKVLSGHNQFTWNYTPSGQPGVNFVFQPPVVPAQEVPIDRVLRRVGTKTVVETGSGE